MNTIIITIIITPIVQQRSLTITIDQDHARGVAALLERWTGVAPALAVSDDPRASDVIETYARSDQAWVVAVRMHRPPSINFFFIFCSLKKGERRMRMY